MLLRSLLGLVLCELAAYFFFLLYLSVPYVAAAAIPHPVLSEPNDPRNVIAAAQKHTSLGTLIRTSGIHEAEGSPSQYLSSFAAVTGLVARETTTGNPSLPAATDTPSSTAGPTTTFSQPRVDPSFTFSDPFPPDPLPTQDVDVPPTAPVPDDTQAGVPTWAWAVGGGGIGLAVLLGLTRLLGWCSRKPQSE